MSVCIFGSTDLTAIVIKELINNNITISAIITIPQSFEISYSKNPVTNSRFYNLQNISLQNNIPIYNYKDNKSLAIFLDSSSNIGNIAIVCGWYHNIPDYIRKKFSLGCFGIHSSLLPQLRGGAPLNWAIINNFKSSGVSIFEMSDAIDEGDIIFQKSFDICDSDYIEDLINKSTNIISNNIANITKIVLDNKISKKSQIGKVSYCGQRCPLDSQIDWRLSNDYIHRIIRASSRPYSGAYTFYEKEILRIYRADFYNDTAIYGIPGQIFFINNKIVVVCGSGALSLIDYELNNTKKLLNQSRLQIC